MILSIFLKVDKLTPHILQFLQQHIKTQQQMNYSMLTALIISIVMVIVKNQTITFNIYKSTLDNSNEIEIGKINIEKVQQYKQFTAYTQLNQFTAINIQDFQNAQTVILTFRTQSPPTQFLTAVAKQTFQKSTSNLPLKQNFLIFIGQDLSIKAINYIQSRSSPTDTQLKTEVVKMQRGRQEIFKIISMQEQKLNQPEQSLWSKYKWPIIIFGIVMYLSSTMSGKEQGAAQAAQPVR